MNEQEKSLELAELMGWKIKSLGSLGSTFSRNVIVNQDIGLYYKTLEPYSDKIDALAQFAAILLSDSDQTKQIVQEMCIAGEQFTQAGFLDRKLRMNGVDV